MAIEYTEAEKTFTSNPKIVDQLCADTSAGGTLLEFCELHKVRFGIISPWLYQDEARRKAYEAATLARGEWFENLIFKELRGIANLDIRGALNDDGSVKPVSQWPADLARAVSAFDVSTNTDKEGNTQENRKLKLIDKLRGIELLMKNRKMLSDRVELSGKVSLEQLVEQSRAETPT